jgi:hypothetical protein
MINALMLTLGILIGMPVGIFLFAKKYKQKPSVLSTFKYKGKTFYVVKDVLDDGFVLSDEKAFNFTFFDENGKHIANVSYAS